MTKITFKILLAALFLFSAVTQAHVGLKSTTPTKDAMLMSSPEQLALTYSGDVKVVKVVLKDADGNQVDFGFSPVSDAAKSFAWTLPKLKASNYKVDWIVMGSDGHKMKGQFSFMVH